jgi:hypothetical protein
LDARKRRGVEANLVEMNLTGEMSHAMGHCSVPLAASLPTLGVTSLEHDPEKCLPLFRLREARFGGRRKVGKDHD